jgi:hypothetical protein
MLRLLRDLPLPSSAPRGLRYVDRGWVGCPASAPRDASIETCLACPDLKGTISQDGAIRAVHCQPKPTTRIA